MDVEDMLRLAGFGLTVHVTTAAEACAWLESNDARFVILDLMVRDGPTGALAARLQASGVPFVVYTGLHRNDALGDPVLEGAVWLAKPCSVAELVAAISHVSGGTT
jgi:DNA-binding response OmpR family regulator